MPPTFAHERRLRPGTDHVPSFPAWIVFSMLRASEIGPNAKTDEVHRKLMTFVTDFTTIPIYTT